MLDKDIVIVENIYCKRTVCVPAKGVLFDSRHSSKFHSWMNYSLRWISILKVIA